MVDRRRSDEYKSLTVYLPNELVTRIKQYVEDTSLPQSEVVEQAVNFYFDDLSQRKPENIAQLVGMNMGKLKEVGFKHSNLSAIARGELLPTRPDFCEILTALEIPKQERKRLWELAYGSKDCNENEKQHFTSH